jgi:crotonobetainyl-CoA:carnitine CoA-transferase CaiB-like acyl-CoA transferase
LIAEHLETVWCALADGPAPPIELLSVARFFDGPFALDDAAAASVAATLLAAAELAAARGAARPTVSLDAAHVALAFQSERILRAPRPLKPPFATLSRFAATTDGYIRLHANYPQHHAALLRALGNPCDEREALARVGARQARELERAIVDAGGAAAAVRSSAEWREHPHGAAIRTLPLLNLEPIAGPAPRLPPAGPLPCSGLRVVDLTRVIAGPVGTRMLAALGADVLRVDPPHLPELELHLLDGTVGKRSTLLDLRAGQARASLERLLATADVLVQSYRPGALAALGLEPARLARRYPQLVSVTLSAWGDVGPWTNRRGFDSLVQAATGIAVACGSPQAPGALPVQALDHATGYLIAAAALRGLTLRQTTGHAAHARLALARTAHWISATPAPTTPVTEMAAPEAYLVEVSSPIGQLRCVAPPGALNGQPLAWPRGVPEPGGDQPRW